MAELSLDVEFRTQRGKNACRRLRATGKVPAVVYGGGADVVPIQVDRRQIADLLRKGSGENTVFLLKVPGTEEKRHTMIRELQSDPIDHRIQHIDFLRIAMTERVRVKVTIDLVGIPVGVQTDGGILDFVAREVEIECLPGLIPSHLSLDVTDLQIGQSAVASAAELPEDVTLVDDPDRVLVAVHPPIVEEEEEEVEEDELLEAGAEEPELVSDTDEANEDDKKE